MRQRTMRRSGSGLVFTNSRYPKMLRALSALCHADQGEYLLTNFLRCDFRGLLPSFQPGLMDAISVLPDRLGAAAAEMDGFMQSTGCKVHVQPLRNTTVFSRWKVMYSLKGKALYGFHADHFQRTLPPGPFE